MITTIKAFKEAKKEMDDNLSNDIFLVKKDELIPIDPQEYEVVSIIDIITDQEQIKKIENANDIKSTNLNYRDVKQNDVVYITVMLRARNKSTATPNGCVGVLKCKVLQTYYGLTVLNQLKNSDRIYQM